MPSSSPACSSPTSSPMSALPGVASPLPTCGSECDPQNFATVASRKRRINPEEDFGRHHQPHVNRKPRFATKYDEMLQPLSPMTYLPVESLLLPKENDKPNFDPECQKKFWVLVKSEVKLSEIESFLQHHSDLIDINEYNSEGRTALHQCCFDGNLQTAELLIRFSADIRLTTRDGFSALHIAAFSGHTNIMFYFLNIDRQNSHK